MLARTSYFPTGKPHGKKRRNTLLGVLIVLCIVLLVYYNSTSKRPPQEDLVFEAAEGTSSVALLPLEELSAVRGLLPEFCVWWGLRIDVRTGIVRISGANFGGQLDLEHELPKRDPLARAIMERIARTTAPERRSGIRRNKISLGRMNVLHGLMRYDDRGIEVVLTEMRQNRLSERFRPMVPDEPTTFFGSADQSITVYLVVPVVMPMANRRARELTLLLTRARKALEEEDHCVLVLSIARRNADTASQLEQLLASDVMRRTSAKLQVLIADYTPTEIDGRSPSAQQSLLFALNKIIAHREAQATTWLGSWSHHREYVVSLASMNMVFSAAYVRRQRALAEQVPVFAMPFQRFKDVQQGMEISVWFGHWDRDNFGLLSLHSSMIAPLTAQCPFEQPFHQLYECARRSDMGALRYYEEEVQLRWDETFCTEPWLLREERRECRRELLAHTSPEKPLVSEGMISVSLHGLLSSMRIFVCDLPIHHGLQWIPEGSEEQGPTGEEDLDEPPRDQAALSVLRASCSAEVAFYRSILSSPHRVLREEDATFHYLPVFPACAQLAMLHLHPRSPQNLQPMHRDSATDDEEQHVTPTKLSTQSAYLKELLDEVLSTVRTSSSWLRDAGRNHFLMLPDSSVATLTARDLQRHPLLHSVIVLSPDGRIQEAGHIPNKDIVISCPYPTPAMRHAHEYKADINRKPEYRVLITRLPGPTSSEFQAFANHPVFLSNPSIQAMSTDPSVRAEQMTQCTFCVFFEEDNWWLLLPEAMMQNCIPVLLLGDTELPYEEVYQWSHFSVRMRKSEWASLMDVLSHMNSMTLLTMRSDLEQYASRFSFDKRHGGAFDEAIQLLGRRQTETTQSRLKYI